MNLLAPVSSIMTTDLITLHPKDPLKAVDDIFKQHSIHHIPIVEIGELVGIISKDDFLHFVRGYTKDRHQDKWELFRLKSHFVKEIMTTHIAKLESTDRINVAIEVFKENILHALPIVDDGRLKGIVTTHDIIKHLAEDKETIKEYNTSK